MRVSALLSVLAAVLLQVQSGCRTQYKEPHRTADGSSKAKEEAEGKPIPAEKIKPEPKILPDIDDTGGDATTSNVRASYRPRCSPNGLSTTGTRAFALSYETLVGGADEMRLKTGEGFKCKLDPGTDSDEVYPLCTVVCPADAGSIEDGWGWCVSVRSFPCKTDETSDTSPSAPSGNTQSSFRRTGR